LRRIIAMARCKEAKFKVAKRHYLQISPAAGGGGGRTRVDFG